MHYDTLGVVVLPDAERLADRLEGLIPSFTYRQLVETLPQLAETEVLVEGSLPMMLAVVRLVDRRRILQSGLTSYEVHRALEAYRKVGEPAAVVEHALEHAIRVLRESEAYQPKQDVVSVCA